MLSCARRPRGLLPSLSRWPALDQIEKEWVDLVSIRGGFLGQRAGRLIERKRGQIVHPHRVKDAVKMVAFMLQERRPGAVRTLLDRGAFDRLITDRNAWIAWHLAV